MVRRALVATVLVAAGMVPLVVAPAASAIPICRANDACLYIYYSTIARTTEIGYLNIPCSGQPTTWGTTSAYFNFSEVPCNS